jgi:hypothetical protein
LACLCTNMKKLSLSSSDILFLESELKYQRRRYWRLVILFISITPILPFLPGKVDAARTVPHSWNEYLFQEVLFFCILFLVLILIYFKFVFSIKRDLKNGTKIQFDARLEWGKDRRTWLDSKLNIKNRYIGVIIDPVTTQTENDPETNIFYYLKRNIFSSKIKTSILKEEFLVLRNNFGTIDMSPCSKKILNFSGHQNDF